MLEIKNLTKRYDETIIKNLNIILPSTGLIIIVGNSGCGKTTLLNLIGGIDQDYEGEILFDHQDIRKIKKYCRRHIGFIFQDFNLINQLALLQYRANLGRNLKISSGITVALICIMITFTLSGSLQTQIKRQLDSIFPNQLISIQNVHKKLLSYHELLSL